MATQVTQTESESRVIEDHRHGERDERRERRTEQPVRIHVTGRRAGGEADRQQDDQRGQPQPGGEHLRADGEQGDQTEAQKVLLRRHCVASPGIDDR